MVKRLMTDNNLLVPSAKIELARRSFYDYCRLCAPGFYKPSRRYLKTLCVQMQAFYESDAEVMLINLPPRHGKSRTATLFSQWILGRNRNEKIIAASYNETLSTLFSKGVRDGIRERGGFLTRPVFSDVFPQVRLKLGDGAAGLWSLQGAHSSFLATSPYGTATGFGCTLLIIDDLIKSAREAYDEAALSRQWEWFANTMLSRLEERGKILVVMTRWSQRDLAGRMLEKWGEGANGRLVQLSMPALAENGRMLCAEILSHRSYEAKCRAMGAEVAAANFQQQPLDLKGRLYTHFLSYDCLPRDESGRLLLSRLRCYIDVADTGADFLCAICYGEILEDVYLLDLIYTDAPMEKTEPEVARMLAGTARRLGMRLEARIESNSGGRGFARSVGRLLAELPGGELVRVEMFYQSKNKQSRILSNATWVCGHVYFPAGWQAKWPDFYRAVAGFQRTGRNAHDDAPDALTGIAEWSGREETFSFE